MDPIQIEISDKLLWYLLENRGSCSKEECLSLTELKHYAYANEIAPTISFLLRMGLLETYNKGKSIRLTLEGYEAANAGMLDYLIDKYESAKKRQQTGKWIRIGGFAILVVVFLLFTVTHYFGSADSIIKSIENAVDRQSEGIQDNLFGQLTEHGSNDSKFVSIILVKRIL